MINNIHYLSGYIIEMALKYRIYRNSNYNRNSDITKFSNYNKIKHHNLKTLFDQCSASISLGNNFMKNSKWSIEERYKVNKKFSLEEVNIFFIDAKKCYKECACY